MGFSKQDSVRRFDCHTILSVMYPIQGDPMMLKSQAGTWRIMEFSLENCHYAKAT